MGMDLKAFNALADEKSWPVHVMRLVFPEFTAVPYARDQNVTFSRHDIANQVSTSSKLCWPFPEFRVLGSNAGRSRDFVCGSENGMSGASGGRWTCRCEEVI